MNDANKNYVTWAFSSFIIFVVIVFHVGTLLPIVAQSKKPIQSKNGENNNDVIENNNQNSDYQSNINVNKDQFKDQSVHGNNINSDSNNKNNAHDTEKNSITSMNNNDIKKNSKEKKKTKSTKASATASVIFNMAVYIGAGFLAYQAFNWVQKGRLPTKELVEKYQKLSVNDQLAFDAQAVALLAQKAQLENDNIVQKNAEKEAKRENNNNSGVAQEDKII